MRESRTLIEVGHMVHVKDDARPWTICLIHPPTQAFEDTLVSLRPVGMPKEESLPGWPAHTYRTVHIRNLVISRERDPREDPHPGDLIETTDGDKLLVLASPIEHGDVEALGPEPGVLGRRTARSGQTSRFTMSMESWRRWGAESTVITRGSP